MKKALVALFAVLMLFAVVSCDKDKSGEMAQTCVNFMDTYNDGSDLLYVFDKVGKSDISSETYDESSHNTLTSIVQYITRNDGASNISVTEKTGTVDVKHESNEEQTSFTTSIDAKSIVVKVSYSNYKNEKKTAEIAVSGNFSLVQTGNDEKVTTTFNLKSLVLNGKTYKDITAVVVYEMSEDKAKFTAATCDGNDVNLDIINAADLL